MQIWRYCEVITGLDMMMFLKQEIDIFSEL